MAPVTLTGDGFGTLPEHVDRVTIGGVACPRVHWVSSSELQVAVPPGTGKDIPVVVHLQGGLSSRPMADESLLQYEVPDIRAIDPSYQFAADVEGTFTVTGEHLGNSQTDLDYIEVGGVRCRSALFVDSRHVQCQGLDGRALDGTSTSKDSRRVTVSTRRQQSVPNAFFEPVPRPIVQEVAPIQAAAGSNVVVLGQNFGYLPSDLLRITVDG